MKRLLILFVFLGLFYCSDNPTGSNNNGIISGFITIGKYKLAPKHEIKIQLEKAFNDNTTDSIDFAVPDKHGFYEFSNLRIGRYHLRIKANEYYTGSLDSLDIGYSFDLNEKEIQSWDFNIFGWYHFSRDTFEILTDTTKQWNSAGTHSFVFNDGVRDTLIWTIEENNIPNWLEINPLQDIFPPMRSNLNDSYLEFDIRQSSFPYSMFGKYIPIVVNHNFGVDTLFLKFSPYRP